MFTLTNKSNSIHAKKSSGFSLTELLVSISIFSMVVAGTSTTFIMGIRAYRAASAETDASCQTSTTLTRMAYGIGGNCGLRAAFTPVTTSSGNSGWQIRFSVPKGLAGSDVQVNQLRYDKNAKTISYQAGNNPSWTIIGKNIVDSTISASATSVQVMIQSQSVIGNKSTLNKMASTISYRN